MTEVTDNTSKHRYEASMDGKPVGFCEYERLGDTVTFTHTVVQPEFERQGVGSALAGFALDDSRARGLKVVPACQFIKDHISRHPEFRDLLK